MLCFVGVVVVAVRAAGAARCRVPLHTRAQVVGGGGNNGCGTAL